MSPTGTPLTVALNARAAVRAEIGGVERMARELVARLPALRPGRYRVIRPPGGFAHRAGHMWEQGVLPRAARECALIFNPANLAPVLSQRNVVVIHDAAALRHPEAYSAAFVAYHRWMLPRLARRARLVLTVSEFSRGELVELLGADPDRIRVVPDGVSERFAADADSEQARRVYGLEGPYVLAVGTGSARKNLAVLEQTAQVLGQHNLQLVHAGSGRSYLRGGQTAVRSLGYVAEEYLPGLYAGARALVMPSRYEGFGLPCMEAMAAGTPVVAARAGALPETVGDAGLLVDPADGAAFAEAVLAVAREDDLRNPLIATGLERAARYSWARTARDVDALLGQLLGAA